MRTVFLGGTAPKPRPGDTGSIRVAARGRVFPRWCVAMVFGSTLLAFGCGDDDSMAGVDAGPGRDSGPRVDTGPRPDTGPVEGCEGGPLAEPRPDCTLAPLPSTGDLREDCVQRINQFRAVCQCLPPLERWVDGEACADEHAEYDANTGTAHDGFRNMICTPGGRGQNECPGYRSEDQVIGLCLQQMWDEGPGEPFSEHGHYINMTNPAHARVACGFFTTSTGAVWAIQNFSN